MMNQVAKTVSVIAVIITVATSLMIGDATKAMQSTSWYDDPYPPPTTIPTTMPNPPSWEYRIFIPLLKRRDTFEDFSYYIQSRNRLYELGQRRAQSYQSSTVPTDHLAVLVFGCAYGDNAVWLWDGSTPTLSEVKTSVQDFIIGYNNKIGSRPAFLTMAIGINASVTPSALHARNWANMIDDLNSWIVQNGYDDHNYIVGAIDIETQWSVSPQDVITWVSNFDVNTIVRAYNFGNALDCPRDQPPTEPQFQNPPSLYCYYPWTQEDMYQVSALHNMFPLPEIYHAGMIDVDSWYRIGLYSKMKHNLTMRFDGSLTQYWACEQNRVGGQLPPECVGSNNSPDIGYTLLHNGLYDPYNRIDRPLYFKTDMIWYRGDPWCMKPGDC